MTPRLLLFLLALVSAAAQPPPTAQELITAFSSVGLPPPPTAPLTAAQESALQAELTLVTQTFQSVKHHPRSADAAIFLKAVRYALDFHEWYDASPADSLHKAQVLLTEAKARIAALAENKTPWLLGSGPKVLGFYSKIDDSPQPYGVFIPKGLAADKHIETQPEGFGSSRPFPSLLVWLHDRDETTTDFRFVQAHLTAPPQPAPQIPQPKGAIIIQPFGRYCNGFRFAGETDVMECITDAEIVFSCDIERVALAGIGMGGAGALHFGAHYADRWTCVHAASPELSDRSPIPPSAGQPPPDYLQKLRGMYDVSACARNFLNLPLQLYSGQLDPQRPATETLLQDLAKAGLHPPYLIGPGMHHPYDPASIQEIQSWMETALAKGRNIFPDKVSLQARSWRYSILHWLQLRAVDDLWADARIDAEVTGPRQITITTEGVRSIDINGFTPGLDRYTILIDDQEIKLPDEHGTNAYLTKVRRGDDLYFTWQLDMDWKILFADDAYAAHKEAGSCMDDLFFERFIFILPDGPGEHPAVDAWVQQESRHAIRRWRSFMRGDPKVMTATQYLRHAQEVHEDDQQANLVLWGDAKSNPLIATFLQHKLTPLKWDAKTLQLGTQKFDAATHVPLMIFPNDSIMRKRAVSDLDGKEGTEVAATGTILLNTGLTLREAHDHSPAQQSPQLPDWAILDITQPPNAHTPGKIISADFFTDRWKLKAH
jgi:pimeloyl-ACP methyl ester carboxylesterase